ncbi:hypothetical protein Trydic_g8740 [Trypoxylus dichotomus]
MDGKNVQYQTFCLKEERQLKVVLRGIPRKIPAETVAKKLKERGFPISSAAGMKKFKEELPIILVDEDKSIEGKKLFDLTHVAGMQITAEPKRKPPTSTQCFRCQKYRYVQFRCTACKCLRCAEEHATYEEEEKSAKVTRAEVRIGVLYSQVREMMKVEREESWAQDIKEAEEAPKKFWRIQKRLGKHPEPNAPLRIETKILYEDEEKAEATTKFLESQFATKNTSSYRTVATVEAAYIKLGRVTVEGATEEVADVIKRLSSKKAPGTDGIPNRALKIMARGLVTHLTRILNGALKSATFPEIWKTATIISLPKKEKDPTIVANRRPISLLSTLGKVRVNNSLSSVKQARKDLPRGSPLSPTLFNIFVWDVLKFHETSGLKMLQFADDSALGATGINESSAIKKLEAGLKEIQPCANRRNSKINAEKTEIIFLEKNSKCRTIEWNHQRLNIKKSGRYLDIHLDSKLNFADHAERRAALTKLRFSKLYPQIKKNSGLSLRMRILKSAALPVAAFGKEIWAKRCPRASEIIKRTQLILARKCAGVPWYTRNQKLSNELLLEDVEEIAIEKEKER